MVRGQTSKLYLRTSEFSRSQNEEQPACRCGFLELHKEPAYTSSWAIKEFIHSFVSSFTEYSERPWPRPCDIQDAGVTKRPGFAFRDLRGCECPPCPPKGWTPPPSPLTSSCCPLSLFLATKRRGQTTEKGMLSSALQEGEASQPLAKSN